MNVASQVAPDHRSFAPTAVFWSAITVDRLYPHDESHAVRSRTRGAWVARVVGFETRASRVRTSDAGDRRAVVHSISEHVAFPAKDVGALHDE